MLLDILTDEAAEQPAERFRTLAASSVGGCGRKLAYSHWPELYPPEPMSARRRMRMDAGRAYEAHVVGRMRARRPEAVAGETAFLWPVPLDHDTMAAALAKVDAGRVVGHVIGRHFMLPVPFDGELSFYQTMCATKGMTRLGGIVLDPRWNVAWLPALSDMIADVEPYGLATAEFKTISTFGFRRVMAGHVDYQYRTQCAVQVSAARLDTHALLYYRIETSHGIELVYSRKVAETRVEVLLSNGQRRTLSGGAHGMPAGDGAGVGGGNDDRDRDLDGAEADARGLRDDEWDIVRVETPFDETLLDQARERVRAVLRSTPDTLPVREYGPTFRCEKCLGTGMHACPYCVNGISKRAKKPGTPCKAEGCSEGEMYCKGCDARGTLDAAPLPFPCSYCAFKASCWTDGEGLMYETVLPDKAFGAPRFMVSRERYERAGLHFVHPEGKA